MQPIQTLHHPVGFRNSGGMKDKKKIRVYLRKVISIRKTLKQFRKIMRK